MSLWTQTFENNQVKIRSQESVQKWEACETKDLDTANLENYGRLIKILRLISQRVSSVDPEAFSRVRWESIGKWLQVIVTNANDFQNNKNPVHIQNANNAADSILDAFGSIDFQLSSEALKSSEEAAGALLSKITEVIEEVRNKGKEAKAELKTLNEAIARSKTKTEETDKTIEQQKGRLDQSIAAFQKQFSDAEAARSKEFTAVAQKNSDAFKSFSQKIEEEAKAASEANKVQIEKFYKDLEKEREAHMKYFREKEEEVKRIFSVIGNVSVAGDYKNTAESEANAANLYRKWAMGLMIIMAGIAVFSFFKNFSDQTVNWHLFAYRLSAILILAVPALYAAQESAKHRDREKFNRKVHLELSAIDAYLELLPVEKRQSLKADLTQKFFGVAEAQDKDERITKHELFELLSKLLQTVIKGK